MKKKQEKIGKNQKNQTQKKDQIQEKENPLIVPNFDVSEIMLNQNEIIDQITSKTNYSFEEHYKNIEHLIAKNGQSLRIRKSSLEFKLIDKNKQRNKKIKKKQLFEIVIKKKKQ